MRRRLSFPTRAICAVLAASLIITAPGLPCYQALAAASQARLTPRAAAPQLGLPATLGSDPGQAPLAAALEASGAIPALGTTALDVPVDLAAPAAPIAALEAAPAPTPAASIRREEPAGERAAASPEKKPVEGALRALARDAAPEAAASSPIGALSALGRVFFGAADKPAGPEDGVALPGGAAPSPAAPGLAPESRRLPLADLVSFLVASKESDREDLARAIRDGEPVRAILARAPGRADYWRDLIQDFAQSQFSDQSRPIVELVTNSIDASRGDFPKEVDVRVSPAATEVSDRGKGMDLRTVLEKLLIPLISGKEGEPTTGRFGVGFFSILQYLKGPESRIEVSTSDGREAYRIVLALDGREPTIAFERLPDASSRGTTVSIRHPLDEAHTGEVLVDALGFNTQSLVRLNGRAINAQAVAAAGAQGSPLLQLAGEGIKLLHGPEGDGRARLSVNGVTIFSEALEGKNVPGTFILDMAVDTQLSVSRNMILVDSYARDQVRRAVDLAAAQPEPFPLVNALTPLIAALQAHNPSPRVEDNLELYLRSKASELAAGSERTLLPDVDLAHELAVESPAFLHPTLFSNLKGHAWPFGEYADFRPRLGGKHRRMLLVPVKTGSGLVVGEYGDVLFLNERHKPAGLVGKALLAAYLRTEGIVGTIRVPRSWWRAALALPLAPLRWLADAVLVFTPRKLADLVYGVKEALLGRKPERAKGFSEQEAKKFKETLRTQERLFLNWFSIAVFFLFAPTIVTGALHFVSPGLVKVLEPFSLLFSMVLNAKYGGALSQGVLRVMRFLRPYGARWGMLNLALPLYFLAYIPLGVASILLTGSPALAEALRVPVVFGLPVLLFLISIRSLLLQWALAAADSLYLAARALPLVWRWFALPTQIRARLRSNLSLRPASWALAVFLALSLSSKEGRAWAAAEGAPARLEAALERVRADPPSYLGIAQGLRLSGSDPALAVDLLADYDAAYFKAYLEMAGTFARRFPSLRLKPGLHGKYSALWRQDLLRQDRASLLKILASLARLSGARGQDIPRTLRPYLLHLLGLNVTRGLAFTQAAEIPEEARAGALEFDLSALLSHHLKGDVLLKSRDEVAAAVAEAAPPMRAKVAARALSNSVNFQSANPYIFMRELAQNVMDEADARQAPPQKRLLQVRTQVADGEVSLSLKDGLGMDFERLVNFLLLPNASTKRGERKAIGQYGHGFLTVLAGAKEVLVRTGTGDGRTLYARLVPRREGNKVVEVRATLAENAEAFAGTEVTWTKESSDPELDAAHLKSQAITLAGLVDERELRVDYDGAPLNKAKEAIGRAATPRGELDLFEFPEENSVVQRGLYIKDLDEEYTRFLPALVRDILLERGIVVQLPRGLRLTRDRGDIVFKNDVLPELGAALGQAALSALVGMYLKGDVAIDQLFPKDFLKDARQHAEAVPEAVLEDVARLNRGEPVADAALYQDPTNLAMLLASVPAIKLRFSARVRGKVSLLWAVKALEEGRIHWLQLPPAFSDLVVGKTLLKILLRYAVRLLIAAVALYFLWHAALAALAGGQEAMGVTSLEEARAVVARWADFARIQPDPALAQDLLARHGEAVLNPFTLALAKSLDFLGWGIRLVVSTPLSLFAVAAYLLWRFKRGAPRRLPAKVEKSQDFYWAFSEWTSRVASAAASTPEKPAHLESVFSRALSGPPASAEQGRPVIFWRIRDFFLLRGPARAFRDFLRGSETRSTLDGMSRLLEMAAHEAAHTGEKEGQWTEDEGHRERQAAILARGLARQAELETVTREVRASYLGRRASPFSLLRSMKAYPETSLDDKLAPGETDEPFPLRSQAEALKAQPAPWTIIGEARRRADGAYAAADELGPSEALAEALQSLAAAGIDPALRAVILLVGPSAEGEGAWFEWTHDGSLLINAGGLGDAAQAAQVRRTDVLIQLLARYALGPGRPRSSRLSPAELEKAGIWPGSALSEEQVLAAARRARRSLGGWSAMRWAAGAAVAALTAFGFALFYSLRDMLNAGFIVPAETPNLLGPTLLLLPALWPLMTWLLRAIRRSFDLLEARGFAPKTGQVSDSARSTHDAVSGRKRNLAFSILPLAFYAGAAFLEEYLFRYLLFHGLGSWAAAAWGIPLFAVLPGAALAAAAVFAVYHFGNWKHLTFKQGAGLILYYGSAALLFSVIYWVSGIWVAAFVHLYYNVRVAGGEAAEEEAAPAQAQPAAPDLRAAWAEAPAEPRLALAGDLLQQRVALLVEAAGKSLPEADKRALLGELASGAFLGSRALSIGFEESDPVLNLKRDLAKRKRLSERGFQRLLHLFLEELPPQLLRPALAYTLERWRAPIERELSEARKAGLTPQLESFRIALESSISASLGAPARVRPFAGESLLRVDPQWSWPLVRAGPEGAEFWISERALYAMAAAPGPWAPELAQMALAARQGGGPLAALKAADFPAYAGLVKAVEPTIETHKPWLARYKPYFLWSMAALWLGTQLLPLAKLLWLAPAAGLAELGARLAAFGANFADPLFAGVFLATLAIDWGTKWWVNRRLPQVDHREFYKAHVGELTLPGGAKWRFTNVLHFVELPRLLFSVLLPVVLVLGGINAAANPVFAAILLAGALGNLGELFLRHGATDWIPLPFGVANAADFAIVLAMAGPWLLAIPELPIGLAIGFLVHRVVLPAFRSWREKRQAAKAAVTAEPTPALDALATGARGYAPEAKSYALSESTLSDLDVFGDEIGLYKTIDKTRTAFGAKRLEHMLRNPSLDIAEIRARQDAVRELLQDEELRKEVEAAFADLGGKADSGLRQDALEPRSEGKAGFHVFGNLLGMWPLALFFIPLRAAAQVIFLPIYLGGGILTVLNRLRETFLRYKAAFRLASRLRSRLAAGRSERLREIGGAFAAVDDPAHPQEFTATARSFSRLLPTSIGSVLDFLYFHGAKTLWWLSRRFARDRERIARVLAALGELDAYLSLAKVALENERWRTFPVLREAEKASLTIEGGHHPALAGKETSVPNGVRLDADPAAQGGEVGSFRILTGANMGGKSTYLRMIGLLTLLAQIGAPVPAASMELTPLEIASSFDIRDSLASGKSLYDAETDRLKSHIERAAAGGKVLILLNELIEGTDPEDRTAIEQAIVEHFAASGQLFVLTTHNRTLAALAGRVPGIVNVHVVEKIVDGKMTFTYEVLPGPAVSRNAVPTLEMKGFPASLTGRARRLLGDAGIQ